MVTYISHSPEETLNLGREWGREAGPGWLFALFGDLGTGKTQLVKGLAMALGIDRVRSPTFALVNEHRQGRFPLNHLDLYRLSGPDEVRQAGLEDYFFDTQSVTVVEWAERWFTPSEIEGSVTVSPGRRLRTVRLEFLNEHDRRIEYEDFGAGILYTSSKCGGD